MSFKSAIPLDILTRLNMANLFTYINIYVRNEYLLEILMQVFKNLEYVSYVQEVVDTRGMTIWTSVLKELMHSKPCTLI